MTFPKSALSANELVVIINESDPQSVAVGEYYRLKRGIPSENIIRINIPKVNGDLPNKIPASQFNSIKSSVDSQINSRGISSRIQAQVLTWKLPYKIICPNGVNDSVMSITSAFTFGYHSSYCKTSQCTLTPQSSYFNSNAVSPFSQHQIRPTMALAGDSYDKVKQVIDRGVASDGSNPSGTAYLIKTRDTNRNVRFPDFEYLRNSWNSSDTNIGIQYYNWSGVTNDYLVGRHDVMAYFTGDLTIKDITTNSFRPGSVADHLTSHGGNFENGGQMHITRWLEAGAVASYGTTTEPCNFTEKFPQASKMLSFYHRGASVIEAYWKSVARPSEGLFVGEPLAKPYSINRASYSNGALTITTSQLKPGSIYRVEASDSANSGFSTVIQDFSVPDVRVKSLLIQNANKQYYRLVLVRH